MTQEIDKRINWRGVITESLFVGASILLAFWIENWGEQQDIAERTEKALCSVKAELMFNENLVSKDYLPRHQALIDYLQSSLAQLQADTDIQLPFLNNAILMEQLRYSSWDLALESGYMLYADFALAAEIGAVYDLQQDSYKRGFDKIVELLFNYQTQGRSADRESQQALLAIFTEWHAQGLFLQLRLQRLLASDGIAGLSCPTTPNQEV